MSKKDVFEEEMAHTKFYYDEYPSWEDDRLPGEFTAVKNLCSQEKVNRKPEKEDLHNS